MEFLHKGILYNYIPFDELKPEDLPPRKTYKQSKYLDIGCGFDIETSKIGDEKLSTMYMWQFAINTQTIIGRTWEEFREFLDILGEHYQTDPKHKLLVFVHNFSFEWQFCKSQVKWLREHGKPSVFATEDRKVLKATTYNYIEFRDSLILTQMSLDKLAKNYNLDVVKLMGDIDYDIPYHSQTPLDENHLAYGINDVQILSSFYHKYIKREFVAKQHKIPLTSTGIVREELKRRYKRVPKKEKVRYRKFIDASFPDLETYTNMIQWLYRGGFTHANASLTGHTFDVFERFKTGFDDFDKITSIGAYDLKSSYPSSLLHYEYPNKYIDRPVEWFEKYGFDFEFLREYSYYGTFEFYGIRTKTQHSIESKNKLLDFKNCSFDNGRLIGGDYDGENQSYIKVMLNEIDMLNYDDFYSWKEVKCLDFHISHKEPLPDFIKDLILQYFYKKETEKDKYLRTLTKYKLNSIYGMMVSSLLHQSLVFNPETNVFDVKESKKTFESIAQKEILLPQWGIYCTSLSRRAVLYGMKKVGSMAIYSDTDSCKILNVESNKWVFDTYNDRMRHINKTMYVGEFDRSIFSELGCFEDETIETGRILKFKTLGAKRYVYTTLKDGKLHNNVTVAGMRKGSLQEFCKTNHKNIYDIFDNGLELDENSSDKLTTSYEDASFSREFVDYLGNTMTVSERSCVTLYKIPFKMKLTPDYLELLEMIQELNNKRTIKRRY